MSCDYCGRHESATRTAMDGNGETLNLCPCCFDFEGHGTNCHCETD